MSLNFFYRRLRRRVPSKTNVEASTEAQASTEVSLKKEQEGDSNQIQKNNGTQKSGTDTDEIMKQVAKDVVNNVFDKVFK